MLTSMQSLHQWLGFVRLEMIKQEAKGDILAKS